MLGNGLGKIASRRAHRPDDADGAALTCKGGHRAAALVELGKPRRKGSRETFLGRHLLKTCRKFAKGLRPPACGICKDRNGKSHISIIFRQRDACINRNLASGNRHIGCICYKNGPFHKGATGPRVLEFRELAQYFRHFIPTLAASDKDNDLGIGPLCKLVLGYRFARAEPAGYGRCPTLSYGKERIDDPLSGNKRFGYP